MLNVRLALLTLYYHATWPLRRWWIRRWQKQACVPMSVLLYHRIASDCPVSWVTSLSAFRQHLAWLRRHAEVVSLHEIQARLISGNRESRPCVAITFDDGYADNLREAVPLLLEARMPFTFFVTVTNLLQNRCFAHDLDQGQSWRLVSPRELRELADSGVEIGSHGLTHADYSLLSIDELIREINDSKHILEDLAGRPVRALAIPFGQPRQMTPEVFQIAYEAGYTCVCSAYGGYNIPGRHRFHIRRFHGDAPLIRLINQLTIDLRLVWQTQRDSVWEAQSERPGSLMRGNEDAIVAPCTLLSQDGEQRPAVGETSARLPTGTAPLPEAGAATSPDKVLLGGNL
ncbi:MAG TPA: polysaccharide deacetylase family protein [Thermogutta sp.]|nr:polysaccharide deacetylase family protein [Thermogutta sp.]